MLPLNYKRIPALTPLMRVRFDRVNSMRDETRNPCIVSYLHFTRFAPSLDPTRRVNLFVGTKLTERPVRNHRAYRNRASPLPINTHSRSPHFLMNRKVNAIDTKRGRSRTLYFV